MAASRSPLVRKVNDFGARAIAFYDEQRPPAAGLGGVLLPANRPYTLWVMASTNKALAATADQDADPRTRAHLRWGKLHAVRTCLGIAGAGAFVCASFLRRVDGKRQISKSA
jgi:hypothetical protein